MLCPAGSPCMWAVQAEARGEAVSHLQTEDRGQGHAGREDRSSGLLRQGQCYLMLFNAIWICVNILPCSWIYLAQQRTRQENWWRHPRRRRQFPHQNLPSDRGHQLTSCHSVTGPGLETRTSLSTLWGSPAGQTTSWSPPRTGSWWTLTRMW